MRIDFEQSGGFANITFDFHAEVEDLPEKTANELRGLIDGSGVLSGAPPEPSGTPAGLTYRLRVSDGPRTVSWQGTDGTLPDRIGPLIDCLSQLAVQARKDRG